MGHTKLWTDRQTDGQADSKFIKRRFSVDIPHVRNELYFED